MIILNKDWRTNRGKLNRRRTISYLQWYSYGKLQFAIQEEQLYAECGAWYKNFYLSKLLCICPSIFETYLNKAIYIIYEKLSSVFSAVGFRFQEK